MSDIGFYVAFEDKYRGSRELIKSRLRAYLPFVQPLTRINSSFHGLDLGCGRGEWLELMRDIEVDFRGVDLDLGMIESAKQHGLNVSHRDALLELQSLDDESLSVVSGFHIAEHLPFDTLKCLIFESFRVLAPGGLLILETPNPENITVGTASFYLDPSHTQPIPSELLSFVSEHVGFERVKVLKLNDLEGLKEADSISLMGVLNGVSPDYAVVSQKAGLSGTSDALADVFEREYGITLEMIANKYDTKIKTSIQEANEKANLSMAKVTSVSKRGFEVNLELTAVRAELTEVRAELTAVRAEELTAVRAELTAVRAELDELKANLAFKESEALRKKNSSKVYAILRTLLIPFNSNPNVFKLIFVSVRKFLNIRARVNFFIDKIFSLIGKSKRPKAVQESSLEVSSELPSRVQIIYADLKAAIQNLDTKSK